MADIPSPVHGPMAIMTFIQLYGRAGGHSQVPRPYGYGNFYTTVWTIRTGVAIIADMSVTARVHLLWHWKTCRHAL